MSEFDKWWEENYMNVSADRTEAEDIYNMGQQSQQAKIDELQARVDEALHAADESCGVSVAAFVKLNRILKGNKDEN